ncbi:hypothetical protein F9K33_08735 [bacterium]|nr:MAG: hypothetical protein F9K33_08735 [bacterium]
MKRLVFFLSILMIGVESCSPVYVPNAVNTPLFTGQNEFHGAGYIRNLTSWDVQVAFTPLNHVGIMANGSVGSMEFFLAPELGKSRQEFFEPGLGFFGRLNPENNVHGDLYIGYGRGKIKSKSDFFESIINVNTRTTGYFHRFFLQAAFGAPSGTNGPLLTCRLTKIDYYKFKSKIAVVHKDETAYFAEPALTIKFGPKPFKFVIQGIFAQRVGGDKDLQYVKTQLLGGAEIQIGH